MNVYTLFQKIPLDEIMKDVSLQEELNYNIGCKYE